MSNYDNENVKILIGFPKVTEIRIGSAMRVAITYYKKLNDIYYNIVNEEKLKFLLSKVPTVYKFKTVGNYINYVIKFYLDGSGLSVGNITLPQLDSINKKFGYATVPCKMLEYLNEIVLPKLIQIALTNLQEEKPQIYGLKVTKEDYVNIYKPFYPNLNDTQMATLFCRDMTLWLEYNQILRIENFYVMENGDIELPIKFSFIEKIGGENNGYF